MITTIVVTTIVVLAIVILKDRIVAKGKEVYHKVKGS